MNRLIIDVEATRNKMVYDFGACVIDEHGCIVREYRAIVAEVWHGMADQMATAHYAEKLPAYYAEQASGSLQVLPLCVIRGDVLEMIAEYGITQVWAYNASYDRDALNLTTDKVSNGLMFYFMPDGVEWMDIYHLASARVCNKRKYYRWALENPEQGLTEKGNLATGAEPVYQYLTDNVNFTEDHTALSDARIESLILWRILASRKGYRKHSKPAPSAWKIPQDGFKAYRESLTE